MCWRAVSRTHLCRPCMLSMLPPALVYSLPHVLPPSLPPSLPHVLPPSLNAYIELQGCKYKLERILCQHPIDAVCGAGTGAGTVCGGVPPAHASHSTQSSHIMVPQPSLHVTLSSMGSEPPRMSLTSVAPQP